MDNFYAYKAENPSGVNSSLCYEGGRRRAGTGEPAQDFCQGGRGDFILGLFPMEGKIEPPLTLVQTNSADVPGHSSKKLFSGRGCYPPPPTSVQIDSTEVSGCSGQKKNMLNIFLRHSQ